jgi:DNA-binding transcriptional LysR family regulator
MPFDDTVLRHVWRLDALVPVVGGKMRHLLTDGNVLPDDVPTIAYPAESMFGKIIAEHQAQRSPALAGQAIVESAFSVGVAKLVKTGVGAAWVPQSLIMPEVLSGDVVILSPDYGRIPMDIALYIHKSNINASNFIRPLSQSG